MGSVTKEAKEGSWVISETDVSWWEKEDFCALQSSLRLLSYFYSWPNVPLATVLELLPC